ncbi:MAG: hypothetical protein AVDCRST_MAG76-1912 [uncultured Acidimicrobiales bacterium]|uniref:Uncharacterized protein n=1 Tax=uncultured Acidimicrobiales bacterium TaxID=310071 RepID=A0A6J4I803_9ACTN|nr:MAG: hypothetical protein AVDCRST_MAG76-1912 [uncultured Acidimicrobiales bacterium]
MALADNEGVNPQPLLEIEAARSVSNPTFTASGALLYTADHGDRVDLHRLEIGELKGTPEALAARPVGWLSDGRLAAVTGQICQTTKPGKLLLVGEGGVEVVAEAVTSAAVRAVLPPPPPTPSIIPDQPPA